MLLPACATLRSDLDSPTVAVRAVRAVPSGGALPDFEIDLHVVNPNASPLALRGIAYSVSLDGHALLRGASDRLPVIAGYGDGAVTLTASPDLVAGMAFLSGLVRDGRGRVRYRLDAKLDAGLLRTLRISDTGEITFAPP